MADALFDPDFVRSGSQRVRIGSLIHMPDEALSVDYLADAVRGCLEQFRERDVPGSRTKLLFAIGGKKARLVRRS